MALSGTSGALALKGADGRFVSSVTVSAPPGWSAIVDGFYVTVTGPPADDVVLTTTTPAGLVRGHTVAVRVATSALLSALTEETAGRDAGDAALSGRVGAVETDLPTRATTVALTVETQARQDADTAAATLASATYPTKTEAVSVIDVADKTVLLSPAPNAPARRFETINTSFEAGHGYTSGGGGVFTLNDTSDFIFGAQSAKVVTTGTGSNHVFNSPALTAFDVTGKTFGVVLKVDQPTKLATLSLQVADGVAGGYYELTAMTSGSSRRLAAGEWALVLFTFAQQTAAVGTPPAKSAVTSLRLKVTDTAAGAITVNVNRIGLLSQSIFPNGVVTFGYDDSWLTQFTQARGHLDKYGYAGVAYIIAGNIGTTNRMTLTQLQRLQEINGWEIAAHAFTQARHDTTYANLSAAEVYAEMVGVKAYLRANGLRGQDHFAWPGGQWNLTNEQVARKFFQTLRTLATAPRETAPPANQCRLGGYQVSAASNLTAVNNDIDSHVANGNWLPLVFHDVPVSGATGVGLNAASHASIVDKVATKNVPVRTVSEVIAALS